MRSKAGAAFILVRHHRARSVRRAAHLPPVALAMWPQMYISAPIPTIDARICTRRHALAWLPQGGGTPGCVTTWSAARSAIDRKMSPAADGALGEPNSNTDVAVVSPVPLQIRQGRAQSQCRSGRNSGSACDRLGVCLVRGRDTPGWQPWLEALGRGWAEGHAPGSTEEREPLSKISSREPYLPCCWSTARPSMRFSMTTAACAVCGGMRERVQLMPARACLHRLGGGVGWGGWDGVGGRSRVTRGQCAALNGRGRERSANLRQSVSQSSSTVAAFATEWPRSARAVPTGSPSGRPLTRHSAKHRQRPLARARPQCPRRRCAMHRCRFELFTATRSMAAHEFSAPVGPPAVMPPPWAPSQAGAPPASAQTRTARA